MTTKGHFYVPIYECYVNVILSDNLKRVINNVIVKNNDEKIDYEPQAFAYNPDNEEANYYLFFHPNILTTSMINHEKSHIIDFILGDRDIKREDEARAYLDGFISDKINKFFKRRKLRIK